jgi:hypothetical protein
MGIGLMKAEVVQGGHQSFHDAVLGRLWSFQPVQPARHKADHWAGSSTFLLTDNATMVGAQDACFGNTGR